MRAGAMTPASSITMTEVASGRSTAERLALVRVDDLGCPDPVGDELVLELCRAGLVVSCGVVPTWLSPECVRSMGEIAEAFPGQVEVHQHGFRHTNHGDMRRKFEFGVARALADQETELLRGREILEAAFGPLFFPAFSPPFGGFDEEVTGLLARLGYAAVSGVEGGFRPGQIPEFATDVDCFRWNPPRERPWDEVAREWERKSAEALFTGILLHPRFMSSASAAEVAVALPALLSGHWAVGFTTLVGQLGPRLGPDEEVNT
jgi:hypothetical protein